jgi:hypothetical protein
MCENPLFLTVLDGSVRVRGLLLQWTEESFPMEINRAVFGALAVFGIVAAGGGAYLANRHNDAATQLAPLYPTQTASAVTETENSIAAPAVAVEPAPARSNAAAASGTSPFVAPEPAPGPANVVRPVSPKQAAKADRTPAQARTEPRVSQRPRTSPTANGNNSPAYTPPAAPVNAPVSAAIEPVENTTVERAPREVNYVAQEPARKL